MPTEVRDSLAAIAASRNTTMLALLEEIVARLVREDAMRQATVSLERLAREDPAAFAEYLAEGRQWDAASGDGLGAAAAEFPEFNR